MTTTTRRKSVQSTLSRVRNGTLHWAVLLGFLLVLSKHTALGQVSDAPSLAPSQGANPPSPSPTTSDNKPTVSTSSPSPAPSQARSQSAFFQNLNMTLNGITSFPDSAASTWIDVTQSYIENYFASSSSAGVSVTNVKLTIQSVVFTNGGRRLSRELASNTPSAVITYSQGFGFQSTNPSAKPESIVTQPFAGDASSYRDELKKNNPSDFGGLSGVSVNAASASNNSNSNNNNSSNNGGSGRRLSKVAVIIISVVCVLVFVGLFYFMATQRGRRYLSRKDHDDDAPPSHLQLGADGDDVSTLADPQQPRIGGGAYESIAGYGDQSVVTENYDYSTAYGGGNASRLEGRTPASHPPV